MKVTVCFGAVRVIVPCGDGSLLVGDLIEKAVTRYRKAIGKPPDYWINVHNFKTYSDGGILDPDDQLIDVADDKEQIIALFDEQDGQRPPHHNGGDGTSASSVSTSSPDIFQGGEHGNGYQSHFIRDKHKNDVIITENDLSSASTLIVRRGSEPSLNCTFKSGVNTDDQNFQPINSNVRKRWSGIASVDDSKSPRESEQSDMTDTEENTPPPFQRIGGSGKEETPKPNTEDPKGLNTFARDSARRSLANNANLWKWVEAQERQADNFEQQSRKEPVGGTDDDDEQQNHVADTSKKKEPPQQLGILVALKNTGGPLGIHVVPDFDDDDREVGLAIQGIEPGGRVHQDGRLKVHDRIIEINGASLENIEFNKAQEIFKQALQSDELRLRVINKDDDQPQTPSSASSTKEPPPLPKTAPPVHLLKHKPSQSKQNSESSLKNSTGNQKSDNVTSKPPLAKTVHLRPLHLSVAPVHTDINGTSDTPGTSTPNTASPSSSAASSPKKVPPAVPARNPSTHLSSPVKPSAKLIAPTNTKRMGKKFDIVLTKGSAGLGFSVTTRDNPAGGSPPIYIKNILPKGAAIDDGRLKAGDRLLEVNKVDVNGKTQREVVNILRNCQTGSTVTLVISRQVAATPETTEKKELNDEADSKAPEPVQKPLPKPELKEETSQGKSHETMHLEIPLNETGSAGLGVSVKGKSATNSQGSHDLGIFIKSIITGGAASKDGRLKVNDQLISVNGQTLRGKTNAEAMEFLRKAMQKDGPIKEHIQLQVQRNKDSAPTEAPPTTPREVRISQSDAPDEERGRPVGVSNPQPSQWEIANNVHVPAGGKLRNPALDRLLTDNKENNTNNALRNTSYQKATHDSFFDDTLGSETSQVVESPRKFFVHSTPNHKLLTRDDLDANRVYRREQPSHKPRPASTIGFLHPESPRQVSSKCNEDDDEVMVNESDWTDLEETNRERGIEEDEKSPTEPVAIPFNREGFGRQSMSEKRKIGTDPKLSEFYNKVKMNREKNSYLSGKEGGLKRVGSAESLLAHNRLSMHASDDDDLISPRLSMVSQWRSVHDIRQPPPYVQPLPMLFYDKGTDQDQVTGPMLGLKKSSSLESLQTAVQEPEEGWHGAGSRTSGMIRGRGTNESFRAAVDHSYDDQGGDMQQMDAVDEEGSEAGSGQMERNSQSSSFNEKKKYGVKKKEKEKPKKESKDKSIFGFLKFGKTRKSMEDRDRIPSAKSNPDLRKSKENLRPENQEPNATLIQNQERLNEQYRILAEKQKQVELQRATNAAPVQPNAHHYRPPPPVPQGPPYSAQYGNNNQPQVNQYPGPPQSQGTQGQFPPPGSQPQGSQYAQGRPQGQGSQYPPPGPQGQGQLSRAERIQLLRMEHQKKHQERQGQYPQETKEELYEKQIQAFEQKRQLPAQPRYKGDPPSDHYNNASLPPRPQPPASQQTYNRPPSRQGQPNKEHFGHYQNIEEIQRQINHHDYYQQKYKDSVARQPQAPPTQQKQWLHTSSGSIFTEARKVPLSQQYSEPNLGFEQQKAYSQRNNGYDRQLWKDNPAPMGRSLTPSFEHQRTLTPPARIRSQTPINQLSGVVSHGGSKQSLNNNNLGPPMSKPNQKPYPGQFHHARQLSDYDDNNRYQQNSYQYEPSYGSLGRRRDHRPHPNFMSSSAQV